MSVITTAISQDPTLIRRMFASIASRYDIANHVLSGGLDFLWRRRAARMVRQWSPRDILDLATGSGDLALTLKRHCPEARVIGSDFCFPMLKEAQRKGLSPLVVADGLALPFADAVFDVVTIAFGLRNMQSWTGGLREMRRVLRAGGHVLVLDFALPSRQPLRGIYRLYLHRLLPLAAGAITGDRPAYEYLAGSIEEFPAGRNMTDLISTCQFSDARFEPLTAGVVGLYSAKAA